MNYWVQTNEDMNPVLVTGVSDSEMQGIIKLLKSLAADGELVELADADGNTIYDNYEQWRSVNSSKRTFTKYPSGYVKASDEVSVQEFDYLVDTYSDSGLGWSAIVAELKGKYGLDLAKTIADTVCYERRYK